jgi:hypothetical protein
MPTPIDVGGNVSNILIGSVALYIAPSGTTYPNVDGSLPIVWPAGWNKVGYTDKGVELSYSPSIKEIKVDEEVAAVKFVLDGEKADIIADLAEGTLDNLNRAVSASILIKNAATGTLAATSTFFVGSGSLNEVMVGFQGYSPQGLPRLAVASRAIANAAVKQTFKRADKVMTPVTFGLLADSTKTIGERLLLIVDQTAPHS